MEYPSLISATLKYIMRLLPIIGVAILLATMAQAAPPTEAEMDALVAKLGSDNAGIRHNAAWRLRDIGLPALTSLQKQIDSPDLEVQTAVRSAIKAIGTPLPHSTPGPRGSKIIQADDDYFIVDFREGKRTVRIEGDVRKGDNAYRRLKLTFTGPVDGETVTQTFAADSEDELKWNSPQAWKYFHSIFNKKSDMASAKVPNDDLNSAVKKEMRKQKFSDADRDEVMAHLKKFAKVCSHAFACENFDLKNAPKAIAAEYKESDALREFLASRHLPIVEGEGDLDPPPDARLGIYVSFDPADFPPAAKEGLVVICPVIGERAERIGVTNGDVIQRINGTPVKSMEELTALCKASKDGMTIDVFREGKAITLTEKPAKLPAGKP